MDDTPTGTPLKELAEVFDREKDLRRALDVAVEETDRAIRAAKDAGATWPEIGHAMDISANTAVTRARRTPRDLDDNQGVYLAFRGEADPPRKRRVKQVRPDGCAGVVDTARALGISKQTVYNRIAAGQLEDFRDETGRRWIRIPQEALDRLDQLS